MIARSRRVLVVLALAATVACAGYAAAQERSVRRVFYDAHADGAVSFKHEGIAGAYESRLTVVAAELARQCGAPAEIIEIEEEGVRICGRRPRATCVGGVYVSGRMRCSPREGTS